MSFYLIKILSFLFLVSFISGQSSCYHCDGKCESPTERKCLNTDDYCVTVLDYGGNTTRKCLPSDKLSEFCLDVFKQNSIYLCQTCKGNLCNDGSTKLVKESEFKKYKCNATLARDKSFVMEVDSKLKKTFITIDNPNNPTPNQSNITINIHVNSHDQKNNSVVTVDVPKSENMTVGVIVNHITPKPPGVTAAKSANIDPSSSAATTNGHPKVNPIPLILSSIKPNSTNPATKEMVINNIKLKPAVIASLEPKHASSSNSNTGSVDAESANQSTNQLKLTPAIFVSSHPEAPNITPSQEVDVEPKSPCEELAAGVEARPAERQSTSLSSLTAGGIEGNIGPFGVALGGAASSKSEADSMGNAEGSYKKSVGIGAGFGPGLLGISIGGTFGEDARTKQEGASSLGGDNKGSAHASFGGVGFGGMIG